MCSVKKETSVEMRWESKLCPRHREALAAAPEWLVKPNTF